jgi:hypothetical protein
MAAWSDVTYPSLVIVAPDTESMSALCAWSVSWISFGTAAVVCGWFGCWSIRTELILSPSKVTSTCTAPLEVLTVEPCTTREADDEEDAEDPGDADGPEDVDEEGAADGVEAGAATSVVVVVPLDGA